MDSLTVFLHTTPMSDRLKSHPHKSPFTPRASIHIASHNSPHHCQTGGGRTRLKQDGDIWLFLTGNYKQRGRAIYHDITLAGDN